MSNVCLIRILSMSEACLAHILKYVEYMFSIYDRNDWNNIVWKATFEVPESPKDFSSWEVIKIPFENFVA